jgi:REP-associated tyrosine transposase
MCDSHWRPRRGTSHPRWVRPPRQNYAGGFFHVGTRGNNRGAVLADDRMMITFMRMFARIAVRYRWLVYAWCLMTTHYHVVVHTPGAGLSEGMRDLNGGYARWSNTYRGRADHAFGKRFGSVLIETDAHLREACRYVVLNPVRAGICKSPEDWPWSSYHATAGLAHPPSFLAVGALLRMFHGDVGRARAAYRNFIVSGIDPERYAPVPPEVPV